MVTAIYTTQPDVLTYMQLPTGEADVWLRQNITETTDEEGNTVYECEEVYFRTTLSKSEVAANFNTIFENDGVTVDEDTGEEVADGITLSDRVEALEDALLEALTLIAELTEE